MRSHELQIASSALLLQHTASQRLHLGNLLGTCCNSIQRVNSVPLKIQTDQFLSSAKEVMVVQWISMAP